MVEDTAASDGWMECSARTDTSFRNEKKKFICCLLLFKGTINTMNMVCMLKMHFF